jgi:DNA helicase II / ATP-dependent DNA helicase PcrA
MSNRLVLAAAGSGKTTYLVKQALKEKHQKILITTFTISNEEEIRAKFIAENGSVPKNIYIQTWFSFLIQHGVKPFQSYVYDGDINGMILVNKKSGYRYLNIHKQPVYWGEDKPDKFYISPSRSLYSDKIAKFACKTEILSSGATIDRLLKIYPVIYVDEVQDMSGYDLEFLKHLIKKSENLVLVGDPRQVTYSTHLEVKYKKYRNGKIEEFIQNECKALQCDIDTTTLKNSYRNIQEVCDISSLLYPSYEKSDSINNEADVNDSIFIITPETIDKYLNSRSVTQLRLDRTNKDCRKEFKAYNFGESKGMTFNNTLIFPTLDMVKWLIDDNSKLEDKTRSQLYVALTRSKHSVGIYIKDRKALTQLTEYKHYC